MPQILDPLVYGLEKPITVIKKGVRREIDAFVKLKILDAIRVEFGDGWFVSSELIRALKSRNVKMDIFVLQWRLGELRSFNILHRAMMPYRGKTKTYLRPHYRMAALPKNYLREYGTFLNPEGFLFKKKLAFFNKVRNSSHAVP